MGSVASSNLELPEIDSAPASARQMQGSARVTTVLIVDDERPVRVALRNVLHRHGYVVFEASSGEDALQLLRDHVIPVDLIVTDIVMPGMTGVEFIRSALIEEPNIPVIYVSGYMSDRYTQEAVVGDEYWVLAKPVYPAMLMAAVQSALAYSHRAPRDIPAPY